MITDILLLTVLILLNGLLSMSEMAVVSSKKARLAGQASKGNRRARQVIQTLDDPTSFLSTIQIGITLIGILTGAYGGTAFSQLIQPWVEQVPALVPYADEISFGFIVAVITYFSLLFGELLPKRTAIRNPEAIAKAVIGPLRIMESIFKPFVWFLSASTRFFMFLAGKPPGDQQNMIDEEIRQMANEAERSGQMDDVEAHIVRQALNLNDLTVRDIMIPRTLISWIDENDSLQDIRDLIQRTAHQHYPVADQDLDHLKGILSTRDLWLQTVSGAPLQLASLLKEPLFVPETVSVTRLVDLFKSEDRYYAVVVDEYGSVQGWVTSAEILSVLVGDPDGDGLPGSDGSAFADGSRILPGMMPFYEFEELIDHDFKLEDEPAPFSTLAGYLLSLTGNFPVVGSVIESEGFRFEVLTMKGRLIESVRVTVTEAGE